jgi:UPF0271 protein
MPSIDLNCDMGESFGAWKMGNDSTIMDHITSANIACGFHAGDATTIRKTVELAIEKGVAVGAHPSYPDLQGFGRRSLAMKPDDVFDIVLYQVSALKGICESLGGQLHHVKPHGALYNDAAGDPGLARAIASAVKKLDPQLILFGLSGSRYIDEAQRLGLQTASEVFADRTYTEKGTLTPRSEPNALIRDTDQAIDQVINVVNSQTVITISGKSIPIKAETVCIHGDGSNALEFAQAIRQRLEANGIEVKQL